jgi:hypothetical protein
MKICLSNYRASFIIFPIRISIDVHFLRKEMLLVGFLFLSKVFKNLHFSSCKEEYQAIGEQNDSPNVLT